jgi:pyruvate dehydrogenase E2 component (dihydrolipoamide acetyltransferase)
MAKLLRMPEVAANVSEAVLQEWAPGTEFAARDVLATVETDKALVDVEATEDGVVLERLVPAGESVLVGAPIAVLGEPGEQVADLAALLTELGVDGARADPVPQRTFASPLARRLAKEADLTIEEITGTGPGGRIVRRDVEAAITNQATTHTAAHTDVPHSRMRQAIATRLTESAHTAPHFYLRATVRVDKLLKLRRRLDGISVTDLMVKAAAVAHMRVPELNVLWTPDAVRTFSSADIAVAVATDRGLVTPVVTGVETRSISALAATIRDLVERARAGRLRQDELEGGTLTVTNLGMYGTEEFAAIINPPQAAILAIGAAREEPIVRKGRLSTGTVVRCTLSVDHRPVDGVAAARWLAAFVDVVEHPIRILA